MGRAYSESEGLRIREAVAELSASGTASAADPEAIFLTDGASKGVQTILKLLLASPTDRDHDFPSPSTRSIAPPSRFTKAHRPLLSTRLITGSSTAPCSMTPCAPPAPRDAPSGPSASSIWQSTGSVLDEKNIAMVLDFRARAWLAVLADEVYQEKHLPARRQVRLFRARSRSHGISDVSLFSSTPAPKVFG